MFHFQVFKISLIFVLSCLVGITTNKVTASEILPKKNPYIVFIASEIVESPKSPNCIERITIKRFTNTPLLIPLNGFFDYTDIIDAIISEDKLQVDASMSVLAQNYVKSESTKKKDPIAAALIKITSNRKDLSTKLLFQNTEGVLNLSQNFYTSQCNLFSIGTLKNLDVQESTQGGAFSEIEEDITERLAGKMTPEFAQRYSETCLEVLKFQINYRLKSKSNSRIGNILKQCGDLIRGVNEDIKSKIVSAIFLSFQSADPDTFLKPLMKIEELSQKHYSIEKLINSFKLLVSEINASREVISICDLYKREVESAGLDFDKKMQTLLSNPIFTDFDNFFKSIGEINPFLSINNLIKPIFDISEISSIKTLKLEYKIFDLIKSEIEKKYLNKLNIFQGIYQDFIMKSQTWTDEDLNSIFNLITELNRIKSLPDIFYDKDSILEELAPHLSLLTIKDRMHLIGFVHFLKLRFS